MRKGMGSLVVMGVILLAGVRPAAAQIGWDAPQLLGPGTAEGMGLFLIDGEGDPGDGLGLMVTLRGPRAPLGLGYRIGLVDDDFQDVALFLGADYSHPWLSETDERRFDAIWFTGAGLGVGERGLFTVPLGVSIGTSWETDGVELTPYLASKVFLDVTFGSELPGLDGGELGAAVEIGLDMTLRSGWILRFATAAGDRGALAVGLSRVPALAN